MKKNFLVTGATGFIGSNLVRKLVEQGEQVSIIVRDKKLNWRLQDIASKLDIHECDIQDKRLLDIVNNIKPDYIFHLARYGNLPEEDNINKMIDVNLKGTINLVNAVKQNPFRLFVNTSSCAEYGIKEKEMKDTDLLEPINNFAIVASATTLYVQKEAKRNNLPIITFRLFTPYGYFEDGFRLIPSVIKSIIGNEPVKVSTPTSVRDFVFIEDVINAYLYGMSVTHNPGEIYNIGSGIQYSIGDVVALIVKSSKSSSDVLWGTVKKQARYIEPVRWQADISKTKKILNWKPEFTIEKGLEKTINWFRNNENFYK